MVELEGHKQLSNNIYDDSVTADKTSANSVPNFFPNSQLQGKRGKRVYPIFRLNNSLT